MVLALGNIRLLSGRMAPQFDAVDFFGPQFALVADQLRAGHLLKWDPWIGGGNPDWVEPELGTTSPVLLAAGLFSLNPQEGYVAYWMAIWFLGGIGMLLLARHLGSPVWGGVIAAAGYITSGFYTGHAEHMSSIYSASFLPWILWRLDAGLQRRELWAGVQAGTLYGLSALGGYPAFTIVTPGFLFLWAFGRLFWSDTGSLTPTYRPTPGFAIVLLVVTIALGGLIFSPPYAGILTGTRGFSDRIGPRPRKEAISSNLLPAGAISTLASPYLANLNFPPKPVWPETDLSMTSIYAGAASLGFALFAWRRRSGWRWWLVLVGAFFLCCALGSQLPLRGWLYDFVPPTRYFRNPALFRAYVILVIAILAALAARDLSEERISDVDRVRLWLIAAFLACSSVVCFSVVRGIAAKSTPELPVAVVHVAVIWFGFATLTYLMKERRLSSDHFLRLVAALALLDGLGNLYISQPMLYTTATVPWWHEMNSRHRRVLDMGSAGLVRDLHPPEVLGTYPNNRNLPLKTSVFDSYITLWNRFDMQIAADPLMNEAAVSAGRLWFSSAAVWRDPDDDSFKRFRERVHELRGQPVLVLHSPEEMLALAPAGTRPSRWPLSKEPLAVPASVPAAVSDVSYTADSLSFRYVAPSSGYLLVTDRWANGWEATVNGQRRPVLGGNFIFRAVQVTAGPNLVQFRYDPGGFWPLLLLSWSTILAVAVWQCGRWSGFRSRP